MAISILFPDDSVMFLDSVQVYNKTYSSNISRHPVDVSSTITDHVSKQNTIFELKGVISSADFHSTDQRPIELLDSTEFNIDTAFNQPVQGTLIKNQSNLLDFLPGSIQQFLGSTSVSSVTLDSFRGYSHEVARDKIEKAHQKSEILTLLDYNVDISTGRSVSVRSWDNMIISNYRDLESIDTGDALEFSLTFEQVKFATIKEIDVQISQQPAASVADETAAENNRGDQSQSEGEETDYFADFVESSEGLGITDITDYIPGF